MAKKQNPILAAFEAKLRKEFAEEMAAKEIEAKERQECTSEIEMISMLIAGNRLGFLGEKRANLLLEEQIDVKKQFAASLLKDAEDDEDMTFTKADLTRTVKQILGPEGWNKHKKLFPLLRDFWDD